ncbi:MAG: hypothetical protein B7X90_06825 [Novosphingobium sp. 17-62-19]|uniref:hypothetical protein n=1 Tax=Novosphingobium sp. 17-62-19 TaxID=1970406 RepID=UPI000BD31EF9|nr:hypothetical protein [Novosphingobium sp. 17-62-19]OYX95942.1 MAG: hypothetical protein B7Y74_02845 [Novosphingobium sp. 35-62-5]OZA20137.1 MAG: hypothetical protein B7X90_06825 [Novosphingobium sp. 17-62-19]HQS97117.1 hypothetical protein [Novosphingobium sp.]
MQQVIALIAPAFGISQPMPMPMMPFQVLSASAAATPGAAEPQQAATPAADGASQQVDPNTTALPGGETEADEALIDGRRRPGYNKQLPDKVEQDNPGAVNAPPPEAFYDKYDGEGPMSNLGLQVGVPDRWRIVSSLCPQKDKLSGKIDRSLYTLFPRLEHVCHSSLDPFHHSLLKGDRPLARGKRPGFLKGDDWFLIAGAVSDTIVEPRSFPIPVGNQTTSDPNQIDVFGRSNSLVLAQTFIASVSLLKGMTAFKPPTIEYRIAIAGNINHVQVPERRVLFVEPSKGTRRTDGFVGLQEAFVDYHLGQYDSKRYDFFSVRAGIQPMQSDFRGFLFNDNQLGIRFFGNRDNNRFQFNLAAFWRLEKDTNSGLNDITQAPRNDFLLMANVYRQDFPIVGLTSQLSATWNINRERGEVAVDKNGFPVRPALLGDLRGRNYDVVYLGYAADGRIGRINLTAQFYGALGHDSNNFLTSGPASIRAFMAAAELSYDIDWTRIRLSGLYASGDKDPYDKVEGGFDAVFENPQFAGADTSYWIRQTIPFAGGGRAISVNGRNGILNSLRSSKEQGQSNFTNPGTMLLGVGTDFDLTPTVRVSTNVNHLWFENTKVLQVLRNEGSIPKDIGWDASVSAIWRPNASQNLVFRLSGAVLEPGRGFDNLFAQQGKASRFYSVLANATLAF